MKTVKDIKRSIEKNKKVVTTVDNQSVSLKMAHKKGGVHGNISSEADYDMVMARIDELMAKGSDKVSKDELAEIRSLAVAAQVYEKKKVVIEPPKTFAGILEMKMYEMSLKQTELAKKLHVSDAKLSLIMSGKQKPDVLFLKTVHRKLDIDANILLEAV